MLAVELPLIGSYIGKKLLEKIYPDIALYRKISIHFRKISNYQTASLLRGGVFSCKPRFSPRSPPCSFFYTCILQGAIDFAEVR